MALETFSSQTSHRGPSVKKPEREKDEENDCLQQFCRCPACNQECDVILILPCSHTMCGRCLACGKSTSSDQPPRRGVSKSACSVLCPCCQHAVELPCWTWSSATSCLPRYPSVSTERFGAEKGTKEGASEDPLQHVCVRSLTKREQNKSGLYFGQGRRHCRETSQRFSHGPSAASFPETPVDGAVDLQEEEMAQSVFGLSFALDSSTVPPTLHLSNSSLTVTYHGETPSASPSDKKAMRSAFACEPKAPLPFPQVCADVVIARGQYYWEVDVCNSSMYRIGVISPDRCFGWWLERQGSSFCAVYDGSLEPVCAIPPQIKTLGVFLNIGGGILSFHNPLTQEHLATLPTRFSPAGVVPTLGLGHGRLRLHCGLPPPPHVFLSKDSAYRRPCGAGGGRWHREIPFRSVRKVIQKFEELAVSDSDSGLVSSFGSSCSTLASLADLGIPEMFSFSHSRQETGAE